MSESTPQKAALEPYVLPVNFVKRLEDYFRKSVDWRRQRVARDFKFTPNRTKFIANVAALMSIATPRSQYIRNLQKIVQFRTQSVTFPDNEASYLDAIDHQIFNQVADALLETLSFGKEQLNMVRQNQPKSVPSFYGSGEEGRRKFEEVINHNIKVGSELLEDLGIARKAVHMKLEEGYKKCSNDSIKNYMAAMDATRQSVAAKCVGEKGGKRPCESTDQSTSS
jgi:hypothetical protein